VPDRAPSGAGDGQDGVDRRRGRPLRRRAISARRCRGARCAYLSEHLL